ncbi:MAG: hypothetical protein ACE5FK_08725, partial [Candidatus Methylomirabilia bacterium]
MSTLAHSGEGARQIAAGLVEAKVELAASVPDTWISRLVEELGKVRGMRSVAACREEEALAIACGVN